MRRSVLTIKAITFPFLCVFFFLSPVFAAQEMIQIHGFGGWGYGVTDGNYYSIGKKDSSYSSNYVALNITASPAEKLLLVIQPFWQTEAPAPWKTPERGIRMDIDYAFAEWTFSDYLRLRAGKVKSPFGIYTEIFDVGTLRPFYTLPPAVYASTGLVTKSYYGLGLTGGFSLNEGWDLDYDLYGGESIAQETWSFGFDGITKRETFFENMVGTRLIIRPPVSGLNFGFSMYGGDPILYKEGKFYQNQTVAGWHHVYNPHIEYVTENLSLRAEYNYLHKVDGNDMTTEGYYVEAAYKFWKHLQAAVLYDWKEIVLQMQMPVKPPLEHTECAAGLNYWFNQNLVFKLSYHYVRGNLFAWSANYFQDIAAETLKDTTHLGTLGVQFSF